LAIKEENRLKALAQFVRNEDSPPPRFYTPMSK